MSIQLQGVFQITAWDEQPYTENDDGSKLTNAKITQTYSGDIEGTSELQYLMAYSPSGAAHFVGIETVTCTIEGKLGSIVLQHIGKFEAGVASSKFTILANSGNNALSDLSGSGSFTSGENGQASYLINLEK
ncbi:DUF3224 domain-containing protein [Glaciecola sp. 2405UD65-10]|jgi:hypothetical protein|uniref:DUF3224 domain-containing protein n=1 Tax=Glaciecola sp. 2405UD65-10 TaxID=3397244 RepID=UPI003B59B128